MLAKTSKEFLWSKWTLKNKQGEIINACSWDSGLVFVELSSWFIYRGLGRGRATHTHTHMRSFGFFAKKRKINAKLKELDFNICPRADEESLPRLHSLYIISLSLSNSELEEILWKYSVIFFFFFFCSAWSIKTFSKLSFWVGP